MYLRNANEDLEHLFRVRSLFRVHGDAGEVQTYANVNVKVYCRMDFQKYPLDSQR